MTHEEAQAQRRRSAALVLYRVVVLLGLAVAVCFSYLAADRSYLAMSYASSADGSAQQAAETAERAQREAASASDYAAKALRAVESQ